MSRIAYALAQISGKPHKSILELHDKYGPVVRIADNELSFNLPDAWKDNNGHRAGGRLENTKEASAVVGNEHNLFGANLEDHSRMRRVLSHGFSMKAMLDQQPLISTHVNLLIQRLHEHCEGGAQPVDMVAWYNRVTFDVISDLSWGEPLGCLEKNQDHPWIAALGHTVKYQKFLGLAKRFPPFTPILKAMIPKELTRLEQDNFALAAASVEKRIAQGQSRPDFMEAMIRQKGDRVSYETNSAFCDNHSLLNRTNVACVKGNKKARDGQQRFPPDARRLRDFRDRTVGSHLLLNVSSSSAIQAYQRNYLFFSNRRRHQYQHCPKPSIYASCSGRDSSPEPTSSSLVTARDAQRGRHFLRILRTRGRKFPFHNRLRQLDDWRNIANLADLLAQTVVGIHHWATYHSSQNFALPESFIPERWLGDPRFANDQREARKPFGFGPRNCIGMK